MLSMKDCIPNAAMLKRRAERPESVKPTPENMQAMAEKLAEYGYTQANKEVYNAVCSYGALMMAGTNYKGLFLKGECGIGKSFGVEVLAAIFQMPVFCPEDFASTYKELDGNTVEMQKAVITGGDFFKHPQDIVIDEIGTLDKVRNYGDITDIMCDVLDWRYKAMLRYGVKTIVTTNLADKEILARYGHRIDDRLREMFYIKRVTGKSLR